jgi:hypothetical protein
MIETKVRESLPLSVLKSTPLVFMVQFGEDGNRERERDEEELRRSGGSECEKWRETVTL